MEMLSIRDLRKSFGEKEVLSGLDLSVEEHSVFGFVGRNGAGKTTTMKAVLGLLRPDGGEILVAGERVSYGQTRTNRHVGYLPDVPEFYPYMTPEEYLRLCGQICGMKPNDLKVRSAMLLEMVGLSGEKRRIRGFSRGMKQRLGIAQALLNRPRLLICDEPTSALDPVGRKEILDLLLAAREQTTVLFSTHILSDVERICTEVAFLNEGKIARKGTLNEMKNIRSSGEFLVETWEEAGVKRLLREFPDARQTERNVVILGGGQDRMYEVLRRVSEQRIPVQRIERVEPTLEALFLEVAKE